MPDGVGVVVGVVTGPIAGEPGVTGTPVVLGGVVGAGVVCGFTIWLPGCAADCGLVFTGLTEGLVVAGDTVVPICGLFITVPVVSVCADAMPKASSPAMVKNIFFIIDVLLNGLYCPGLLSFVTRRYCTACTGSCTCSIGR